MLTHLLFSISALIVMIIFIITYFTYKKNTSFVRSKIYVYMIFLSLALTIIEIIEGITYVYNISIIFSLTWKLHSIIMIAFFALLFYYLLVVVENKNDTNDIFWDSKNLLSVKNLFSVIFILLVILSIVFIKTYPMYLTMFYFYTKQSINCLLIIYAIYILYNGYIVYLKIQKDDYNRNDYIILIGTFILFVAALIFEYLYAEMSIYSTLFTLVLILIYYFKENEDLLIIESLEKNRSNLYTSNDLKLKYINEIIDNLDSPLKTFKSINKDLEDCNNIPEELLIEDLNSLNKVSNNLVNVLNDNRNNNYRIDELVKNIEEIINPSVKQKGLKLSYNVDQSIPSLLVGDYQSIQRIIINLLNNAIEKTDVGKIIITINGDKRRDIEFLTIKISDTGIGIKPEDFDKVFLDDGSNPLAATKKYVEGLGGTISFESNYGSGTIFYVNLSQHIANETPIAQIPLQSSNIVFKDFGSKKVLLVDDDDYSTKKLTSIFKKYNLEVENSKTGTNAINMIKDSRNYSLIIINENIKDMNLLEFGKLLKFLDKLEKVPPTIALILNNDKNQLINSFEEFLTIPIDIKKLDEIINRRLI